MSRKQTFRLAGLIGLIFVTAQGVSFGQDAVLPEGAKVVWDLAKAHRETTPTRERICINGLWRWQAAKTETDEVPAPSTRSGRDGELVEPADGWGYLKVPGPCKGRKAWYQREITIPKDWSGRHITVCTEYLNSYAAVYVDGVKMGQMRFPRGEVDITSACRPGGKHVLSVFTAGLSLKAMLLSYKDVDAAMLAKGGGKRPGLCGDVYLVSAPAGARIADVKVDTSTRKWELTLGTALEDLKPGARYTLRSQITDGGRKVKEFASKPFTTADLKDGRFPFISKWKPDKLWDTHTPGNMYHVQLSLLDSEDKVLDTYQTVRFGFREIWVDGRYLYLNGTRVFGIWTPLDNGCSGGIAYATYDAARESILRWKAVGVTAMFTHNYSCHPGAHLSYREVLRAADDVGMLIAFSVPRFRDYKWDAVDADETNGYALHVESYVRMVQDHPSVVMYATSHSSFGSEKLKNNPDFIDGIQSTEDKRKRGSGVKSALRAEGIIRNFDRSRVVYHQQGGNAGATFADNLYLNFVPIQERSDYFEHWATQGVKPLIIQEYGSPWCINWMLHRGWFKGKRSWGSAAIQWEFCNAEWNAQFLGDTAYQLADSEKRNLRWETKQFRAGGTWHRWDYPCPATASYRYSAPHKNRVWAMYHTENWRAFRTWRVTMFGTWSISGFWRLRDGANQSRKDLKTDWDNIQKPGYSPPYIPGSRKGYRRDLAVAVKSSEWIPTGAGKAFIRNSQPLLVYIGGKPGQFTSKDHNFLPGETVRKQLIIINNSRETVTCDCSWSLALPQPARDSKKVTIETGRQERILLRIALPAGVKPGAYKLSSTVKFGTGETQSDTFDIHVLPRPVTVKATGKIALFDPKGETTKLLKDMGIKCDAVDSKADLAGYEMLIVGKKALTSDGPAPDIVRVRDGLKVILFEQTSDVLEKRFGLRVVEYGLRRVFTRVSDHPLLAGLTTENLHDWRGEATIVPPRMDKYKIRPRHMGLTVTRCGIKLDRPWRCGCRGNVASVLIEKPTCGNFLPLVDGGFSLQYSPLMVYREGSGVVVFCQLDVTGRSETEPAAQRVVANILNYVSDYSAPPVRKLLYVGEPTGQEHLKSAGYALGAYEGGKLNKDQVLLVGPGGGGKLAPHADAVKNWLNEGGHLLAVGLGGGEANSFLPFAVTMKKVEHIAAYFEPAQTGSLLAGVGPADVHNRDPRKLPLVTDGARVVGNGVLARSEDANMVFCQLVPWTFDYRKYYNQKRTYRRTSFLLTRILSNMGVFGSTPVLERFSSPVKDDAENRWLEGLYLEKPVELDDPYRYFRW